LRVRQALAVALLCLFVAPALSAYSVLTHEAIVDLLWESNLQPMLKARFPHATAEELKEAHAYAYGGCIIQDAGYYPFGNKYFSDLTHYVRSGDFVDTLLRDATNVNEYAFALGALSHYSADVTGHPTINRAVAMMNPKLEKKFGQRVTYAQDPRAHIRTEFGFDMAQMAKKRYASDQYHNFIGFEVSQDLLERAFRETYGMELKDVMAHEELAIGTYRWAISSMIPKMTKAALHAKREEIFKDPPPNFSEKKFLYTISRAQYEKEWGKNYQRPGIGTRILGFFLRFVPKRGPFSALAFQVPTPQTETMYFTSINKTVDAYRALLGEQSAGALQLQNVDFDTAEFPHPLEYSLADKTYERWLHDLVENHMQDVTPEMRKNLDVYFADPKSATLQDWPQVQTDLEKLKAARVQADRR
jgi:zinc dependent phospholipase C